MPRVLPLVFRDDDLVPLGHGEEGVYIGLAERRLFLFRSREGQGKLLERNLPIGSCRSSGGVSFAR